MLNSYFALLLQFHNILTGNIDTSLFSLAQFQQKKRKKDDSFQTFSAESIDRSNLKSGNTWLKQLMQISGVSYQIAKVITRAYPSLHSLMKVYENPSISENEKRLLLAHLERPTKDDEPTQSQSVSNGTKKIGQAMSNKIYSFFTQTNPSIIEQDLQ